MAVAALSAANAAAAHAVVPFDDPLAIEIDAVGKTYASSDGAVTALGSVSLDVRRGEFISLLGPSGCGKTTLLRMVAGLEDTTTGHIHLHGRGLDGLGFVFQRDVLLNWRTILQNVLLPIEFRGGRPKQYRDRALALLATFGLAGFENKRPWELSGGMRQRAAICRALIDDPELLLMDEPFGALDALTRDELNVELQTLWHRSRKTTLFVTHSIPEAVFLSDRVVVISDKPGRIVEVLDIDFPRPRGLDIREEPAFGHYSRHLRDVLERHGAFRKR
ncbi:ABC transporter ATP-binding protein [Rhodoplanes roseus]|uniref:ABC transporter ATP-binding protein n=1 Tax=Rhodoplanes roseus TaxID=29409 RepID=A0A327L230_9BRAD|nr:ABC transporter ATP-binding protein [Rhodoplanes roseus]RAI44427.1 ABC transporter ATP-binding protein [Rhodoplanes roseus]